MSSFRSASAEKLSKSIKIDKICDVMCWNNSSEPRATFQRGSGQQFATVDVKKLIFWDACSVPDLFNCKHKPFISTVMANANRLLTYAGHSH